MISRVMPFINQAVDKALDIGKAGAAVFTVGLIAETVLNCMVSKQKKDGHCKEPALNTFGFVKAMQQGYNFFVTDKKLLTLFHAALQLKITRDLVCEYTDINPLLDSYRVNINASRPPLVSFIAVAAECVNISVKIAGSLAVAKVLTGEKSGKIRMVVAAVLLSASAWNIWNVAVQQDPQPVH